MKTVLIVDDNRIIVNALCTIVDWERFGFNQPLRAFDGEEALEKIMEFDVNLLITDIKMPKLDGITLLQNAVLRNPALKSVVLSAHDDFQYVRTAFKLGATEYILKTDVSQEMVEWILQNIADEDNQKQMAEEARASFMEKKALESPLTMVNTDDNRRHIKELLINGFLRGLRQPGEIDGLRKSYPFLMLENKSFAVMSLKLSYSQSLLKSIWKGDIRLLEYAILNIVDEVLREFRYGDAASVNTGELAVLFSFDTGHERVLIERCTNIFNSVQQYVRSYLDISLTAGMAVESEDARSIRQIYQNALDACNRQIMHEHERLRVYSCDSENERGSCSLELKFDIKQMTNRCVKYLKTALESYNPAVIEGCIGEIAVSPDLVDRSGFENVLYLYQKYFFLLSDFISENDIKDSFDDNDMLFNQYINGSLQELNRILRHTLCIIAEAVAKRGSAVRQTVKYINGNYFKDINLTAAAEVMGFNRQYLGRIFLREMGMSFNACLNDVRIRKAKELITNGNIKMYQVSELVGYTSFEHFSRVFKKIVGIGPKEFAMQYR